LPFRSGWRKDTLQLYGDLIAWRASLFDSTLCDQVKRFVMEFDVLKASHDSTPNLVRPSCGA
jgi:hypothetical protein